MMYIEYERLKQRYYQAQKDYDSLLQEKEALFERTQPNSMAFDKERVIGGKTENTFDKYLIIKERTKIEERLAEARDILADRKKLAVMKQEELEASIDIHDKVYVCRYIKRYKIKKIARELKYSEPQVNRIIKIIKNNLKQERAYEKEIRV